MAEILYTGTFSAQQLKQLIADCAFQPDARFLGEKLPDHIVDDTKRENLLLFTWYVSNLPFTNYTTGRIFNLDGELRWERSADKFQVVYLGSDQYKDILEAHQPEIRPEPGFTELMSNKQLKITPKHYLLFGKFLAAEHKHAATPENHSTYAEARIPRLLHYPLPQQKKNRERVGITVAEYVYAESGRIFAYRFQGLQAMKDESEQKGA